MFEYFNIFVMVDIISVKCKNFLFSLNPTISLYSTVHDFHILRFKTMMIQ
jgi:hypothetical protein